MGRVAVIGERTKTEWFVRAGAQVMAAETAEEARRCFAQLAADTVVILLTPMAAEAVTRDISENDDRLVLTLPARGDARG